MAKRQAQRRRVVNSIPSGIIQPVEFPFTYHQLIVNEIPELQTETFFAGLGFSNWRSAVRHIQNIATLDAESYNLLGRLLPHLLHALSACADPDQAMINMERFIGAEQPSRILQQLLDYPRAIEILATIFSASQFLTEILLRNPGSVNLLLERKSLSHRKSAAQYQQEAEERLPGGQKDEDWLDRLRLYQRGEMLRIGTNDLLDYFDLDTVINQLSNLADGLTCACLNLASRQTGTSSVGFVVLAMGKLGGQELNYSSDIDLLFVANENAHEKLQLGEQLIENLAGVTPEGFLYRVDMRLRPWGKDGFLVTTIDGYQQYLTKHARLWEKQALLKARPIAGDLELGRRLLEQAQDQIFLNPPEEIRASVYAMKQRIEQILLQKGRKWGEVKLGEGSIRDVEFVVQYLQLAYGRHYPDVRGRSTLAILPRLGRRKLLSRDEVRILSDGYVFLRTIEHFLQMMHYRQTDTLPSELQALVSLARRLGYLGSKAGEHFINRYQEHCLAIRAIYLRHIGSVAMTDETNNPIVSFQVQKHLARLDGSYPEIFPPAEIQKHAEMAEKVDEATPAVVDAVLLEDGSWRVTIIAYDYPGELSIICGLLFVHGFNILGGHIFTYEPVAGAARPISSSPATAGIGTTRRLNLRAQAGGGKPGADVRPKIVDVFTVKSVISEKQSEEIWLGYSQDLDNLIELLKAGQRREARGQLAKRVGAAFQTIARKPTPLYPIDVEIDNDVDTRYTVLRIDAPDTVGFLYEFTNALAFARINIVRMIVESVGNRAQDILFVTDFDGKKITTPEKQRELRASIVLIKHFTHLLPLSPNPETALLHFREFLGQLFQRPNWPDELASIEKSNVLSGLARVLGVSDFLWDDFLRMQYANLFPVVKDMDGLSSAKPRAQLAAELENALETRVVSEIEYPDWRGALNAFKDRELFRIDMRHILGLTSEFWDFAIELTELAELVVTVGLARCQAELEAQYGAPLDERGQPSRLALFALGKCGGRELGFASDIELMFVYDGMGSTQGPAVIDTCDYYERLVPSLLTAIRARMEGIFQIDLQLRPYGKAGAMAVSLESFKRYYAPDGPAWAYERQALVKLRQIAGDPSLGQEVSGLRDGYVYDASAFDVTAMRAMRERQIRHLVTGGTFNAKYSPGGLVDIEYLIQGLQINHGAAHPSVRATNLREAMSALHAAGVLSDEDFTRLRKAHTFLRWLIDSLRVVRGNSKDTTVPAYNSEEFAFLARRLRYENDINQLWEDMGRFVTDVQEINHRLLG